MKNTAPGRAARGVARHGTQLPPPSLPLSWRNTLGAYFYGLYYFAFLECALPGVNPRPQFGQCSGQEHVTSEEKMTSAEPQAADQQTGAGESEGVLARGDQDHRRRTASHRFGAKGGDGDTPQGSG